MDISRAYELIFPEFDVEDNQEMGTAIAQLMAGMTSAKAAGWISDETAMKILFKFADMEVDIIEERERIAAQQGQLGTQPGMPTLQPGQQANAAGPDETEQPAESKELAGKIKGIRTRKTSRRIWNTSTSYSPSSR